MLTKPTVIAILVLSVALGNATATAPVVADRLPPASSFTAAELSSPGSKQLYLPFVARARLPSSVGIWLSPREVQALPLSGAAWSNVKSAADTPIGTPDLANQDDPTGVYVLAKALVYLRTGDPKYHDSVVAALYSIQTSGTYEGRALALGRNLAAYVISADLIGYRESAFVAKVRELRDTPTTDEVANLIECHEKRANNWGTMCGASRIAADLYIGDDADLARAVAIFRGFLGDRSAYSDFDFGPEAFDWMCDPANPRPMNPPGCVKDGYDLSGALVDDVRRGGAFQLPPLPTEYAWGGFCGIVAQAEMLSRAGYPAYEWESQAIQRGMNFLQTLMPSSESNATQWIPWVVNHHYRSSFVDHSPVGLGRLVGWTDWTHGGP